MGCGRTSILFPLLFQRIGSLVTIFLKLYSLSVDEENTFCDPGLNPSACDLYLKICLRGSNKDGSCDLYIVTPRNAFPNQNKITFGESIDYIENPVSVRLMSPPVSPQMIIEVHEADSTIFDTDDLLTSFRLEEFAIPVLPKALSDDQLNATFPGFTEVPMTTISHNIEKKANITVQFTIWAQCLPPFYGTDCHAECSPRSSLKDGYYGCELTSGSKICVFGWYGENCDKRDVCATEKPCGTMGICENVSNGFRCVCRPPYEGIHCSQPLKECTKAHRSLSGQPKPLHCLNGGFCMRLSHERNSVNHEPEASGPKQICICQPGFTGSRCELDEDECLQEFGQKNASVSDLLTQNWNVPRCSKVNDGAYPCCSPQAKCVNTYGSYNCICPLGWFGVHCEYPPTLWPTGYHPMLLTANVTEGLIYSLNQTEITESFAALEGKRSVWTVAFLAQLAVFPLCLPIVVIFFVRLRRRRKTSSIKSPHSPRTSVRYTRPTGPTSLPQIPNSETAVIALPRMKPVIPDLCRFYVPAYPSNARAPSPADDVPDYEELTYGPCASCLEEKNSMYDRLGENAVYGHAAAVDSIRELKPTSLKTFPTICCAAKQASRLVLDGMLPPANPNLASPGPTSLQPLNSDESSKSLLEHNRTKQVSSK